MVGSNAETARVLGELATLTELDEGSPQAFRVRAYQNAQRAVEHLDRDVREMTVGELAAVKGIGKSIAAKIREYCDTGTISKLEALRAAHPPGELALLRVPGVGAKTVSLLRSQLGVTDLDGLRAALEDGRIAALPGMGDKTADNLRNALSRLGTSSKDQRVALYVALPLGERLVRTLGDVDGVEQAAFAGSLRRFRDSIGDIDVLVAATDPHPVTETFLALPEIREVVGSGGTKTSVMTQDGVQVDLRVVPPESFGAALLYFTGSKAHNIRLRQRALQRGWTLNEYALAVLPEEEGEPAGAVVAQKTEEEVYAALDLPWIPAELREDDGEIEAAAAGELPDLVTVEDLRGDLHDHTDWSGDGRDTLEDMVAGAVARGLEYLAITDHAENLRINGISRAGMQQQRRLVRELEQARGDIRLLHGAELNIGADGSLDYDPEFLATFDWLVASVHSHFSRPVAEQTARLLAAIRHPSVTAIGHLSGRMQGKRPGIEFDVETILNACAETGTALEINSNLKRLDAPVEIVREGAARGVTFVISTDAHSVGELANARHGVAHARRAALPKVQIANTWEADRFLAWVAGLRSGT